MRLLLPFLVPLLLCGCYDQAVDAYCELRLAEPRVDVTTAEDPVVERNTLSRGTLRRTLDTPASGGANVTLGVTTASMQQKIDVRWRGARGPGFVCATPAVRLELRLKSPVVDIASELAPGSCRYAVIREHEEQHLQAYREHLVGTAQKMERLLKERYPADRFLRTSSRKQFDAAQAEELDNWLAPTVSALLEGVRQRHAQIDHPQEYERLTAACPQEPLEPDAPQ